MAKLLIVLNAVTIFLCGLIFILVVQGPTVDESESADSASSAHGLTESPESRQLTSVSQTLSSIQREVRSMASKVKNLDGMQRDMRSLMTKVSSLEKKVREVDDKASSLLGEPVEENGAPPANNGGRVFRPSALPPDSNGNENGGSGEEEPVEAGGNEEEGGN